MNAASMASEAGTRTDPALAYRRLRPGAPVGFSAAACLPLRSRYVQCGRCVAACPVKLLSLTNETLVLADGCLGCGRCLAACPTGALAVAGFSRKAVSSSEAGTLYLDCWKVPPAASPQGAVRVPCLGGLSVGRLLGFCVAAGQRPVALLDRGWCRQCPAGGAGEHPVQAALSATQSWLREIGVPPTRWPQLARQRLPASDQAHAIPDAASEQPVSRRDFLGRLAHQATTVAAEAMGFEQAAAAPSRTGVDRRTPVRALERERQLVSLKLLAARHGRAVPAHFFPAMAVNADCCNHRLCARLCPTGALLAYETDRESGVRFDAAACIACGQCEAVCPEKAIRLLPAGNAAIAAGAAVLTRHARRTCVNCGVEFADPTDRDLCPACRRSHEFANASCNQLFPSR
ncbi:MAG TPA: 4Fe-4S binding protein [Acidiferrobacterales bacterium]|nr:4Fe-4S binding protein [Acidiferrobacterales bacterium]